MADTLPFASPLMTFADSQRLKGSEDRSLTSVPWPIGVASTLVERPAGTSPCSITGNGIPPGYEEDAGRKRRCLRMRDCTSSQPSVSISHFIRARSLLSRFPA